jgi:serine/threonine protein kinase
MESDSLAYPGTSLPALEDAILNSSDIELFFSRCDAIQEQFASRRRVRVETDVQASLSLFSMRQQFKTSPGIFMIFSVLNYQTAKTIELRKMGIVLSWFSRKSPSGSPDESPDKLQDSNKSQSLIKAIVRKIWGNADYHVLTCGDRVIVFSGNKVLKIQTVACADERRYVLREAFISTIFHAHFPELTPAIYFTGFLHGAKYAGHSNYSSYVIETRFAGMPLVKLDPFAISAEKAHSIVWQMATCLQSLHSIGFVHGDAAVQNFVLLHDRVRMIDFGSSVCMDSQRTEYLCRATCIAPEGVNLNHAQGMEYVGKPSAAWDVWAFGVALWWFLFGTHFVPDHISGRTTTHRDALRFINMRLGTYDNASAKTSTNASTKTSAGMQTNVLGNTRAGTQVDNIGFAHVNALSTCYTTEFQGRTPLRTSEFSRTLQDIASSCLQMNPDARPSMDSIVGRLFSRVALRDVVTKAFGSSVVECKLSGLVFSASPESFTSSAVAPNGTTPNASATQEDIVSLLLGETVNTNLF